MTQRSLHRFAKETGSFGTYCFLLLAPVTCLLKEKERESEKEREKERERKKGKAKGKKEKEKGERTPWKSLGLLNQTLGTK